MCKLACCMIVLLLLSAIALAEPIQVTIDILPGDWQNTIGIHSRGSLPVAIWANDDFKAASIDYSTLQLSGVPVCLAGKHQSPVCVKTDLNADHAKDLVAEFPLESFSGEEGQWRLTLTGRTKKGLEFSGSDMLACSWATHSSVAAMAGRKPDIDPAGGDGGILFCWDDFSVYPPATIEGYLLYRDYDTCIYGDGWAACAIPWPFPPPTPVIYITPTSAVPFSGPAGTFNHSAVDDELDRIVSYWFCFPQPCEPMVTGLRAGEDYFCRISCLYSLPLETGEVVKRESRSFYAGHATYLSRPIPVSPANSAVVDLSSVTFEWQGSATAFRYVIEVSPSPNFERANTWVTEIAQVTDMDGEIVSRTFTDVLNRTPELARFAHGGTLYWRVGARNIWDNPGAYPAGPSPLAEGEKNTRYIYNSAENVLSFTVGDDGGGPPPPPPPL